MRRVEQRATGQFLKVQGPVGVVVSIAGWMLDPATCAGMTLGSPRVDVAALIELKRLLKGLSNPTHSRIDVAIVREEANAASQVAGSGTGSADGPVGRRQQVGRVGRPRAEQDHQVYATDSNFLSIQSISHRKSILCLWNRRMTTSEFECMFRYRLERSQQRK